MSVFFYSKAQDIHYSRIDMIPVFQNAANTGAYLGSLRVGAIYREQWNTSSTSGFRSPLVFIDAPVKQGFSKNDWYGLGFMIFNDQTGAIELSQSGIFASLAYHKSLSKHQKSILSLGYQVGFAIRQINAPSKAVFLDELEQFGLLSDDRNLLNLAGRSFVDMNLGATWRGHLTPKIKASAGLNVRHINRPNRSLIPQNTLIADLLYTTHLDARVTINHNIALTPQIFHLRSGSNRSTVFLTDVNYTIHSGSDNFTLSTALGLRTGDAFLVSLGVTWNRFKVMMHFDVPYSDVRTLSGANGVELAGNYIFKLKRKRAVKPIIFCPRF